MSEPSSSSSKPSRSPPDNKLHGLPPTLTASAFKPPTNSPAAALLAPLSNLDNLDQNTRISNVSPSSSSSSSSSSLSSRQPPIPEKCYAFCTQGAASAPWCRMICFRRRLPIPTREESLKRLRPTKTTEEQVIKTNTWNPFERLKKKIEPYSIIYMRGYADGIVGRYMEEMESDDGYADFGVLSRRSEFGRKKKREESRIEYMDWGDEGMLLHLPLTSLFHPIISIPNTIQTITTPSIQLLSMYKSSWTDGSQNKAFDKFSNQITSGGAWEMLSKVRGFWEKKVKERQDEIAKIREAQRPSRKDVEGEKES